MPKPKNRAISSSSSHGILKTVNSLPLPKKFLCPPSDIFELFEKRRSRREFSALNNQDISSLLWFTLRHVAHIPDSEDRILTPIPTAGALASVKTVVIKPSEKAWIYNASNHHADILPTSVDLLTKTRISANEFFNIDDGTLLLFYADRSFVEQYYESPDSLILREAGVLLCALALIAEALELSFCPLGTTAEKWLTDVLGRSKETIIAAGAAIVGRRQSTAIT